MSKRQAINSDAHDEVMQQLAEAAKGLAASAPLSGETASTALTKGSLTKGRKGARLSIAAATHAIQKPKNKQASLFDTLQHDQSLQRQIQQQGIEQLGAVLSGTEWRALIAISRLLQQQGAYDASDNHYKTAGEIRAQDIVVTQKQFYDAYGVKRIINNRNEKDYQASEAQEALSALLGLNKPILQVYGKQAASGKIKRRDAVRTVAPLVITKELYQDITSKQEQALKDGDTSGQGLKYLRIAPSDIFYVLGFMYLPEAVYRAIEQRYSGPELSPTLYNLTMVLALEVHNNKADSETTTLKRNLETLAYNIGKGQRIETRQKKRLKAELDKEAGKLRDVGAIKGKVKYTTGDGVSGEQAQLDIVRAMFGTKDLPEATEPQELDE